MKTDILGTQTTPVLVKVSLLPNEVRENLDKNKWFV
jgi:hypothetical protein